MSIIAIGALVGPPISGAINAATGGFEAVGYFAGESEHIRIMRWSDAEDRQCRRRWCRADAMEQVPRTWKRIWKALRRYIEAKDNLE